MSSAPNWDPSKAASNLRKHGVTFQEAATALDDPRQIVRYDHEHSNGEDRYLLIGLSGRERLLLVVFSDGDDIIRVISARRATKAERQLYEHLNHG